LQSKHLLNTKFKSKMSTSNESIKWNGPGHYGCRAVGKTVEIEKMSDLPEEEYSGRDANLLNLGYMGYFQDQKAIETRNSPVKPCFVPCVLENLMIAWDGANADMFIPAENDDIYKAWQDIRSFDTYPEAEAWILQHGKKGKVYQIAKVYM